MKRSASSLPENALILGIDEAGRGALAGPVYVAGAILPRGYANPQLKDSKLMTAASRDTAYDVICRDALFTLVLSLSNIVIDTRGIAEAIYLLVREIDSICRTNTDYIPDLTVFDGAFDPIKAPHSCAVIKGDRYVTAVSAASILAKVSRDREMCELAEKTSFAFSRHKGYGTKAHIEEIRIKGYSPWHRRSFIVDKLNALF